MLPLAGCERDGVRRESAAVRRKQPAMQPLEVWAASCLIYYLRVNLDVKILFVLCLILVKGDNRSARDVMC
jgi:hypothetical protein